MIVKLALAALISGIAISALAIHHLGCLESQAGTIAPGLASGADSTVSAIGSIGGSSLGPFLSGLI